MGIGRLLLRIVVGGVFVAHGMQKLTGAFGGGGLDGAATMMKRSGLPRPRRKALLAALAETVGGTGIVLGAAMPVATAATTAAMATAIRTVHRENGPWNAQGGYEYNVTLIAASAALTIEGPGPVSVDALIGRARWGAFWGLLAVGTGVLASSFVTESSDVDVPGDETG